MRLLSWNLNARRSRIAEQVAVLAERAPDVVALQEVTPSMAAPLSAHLRDAGLAHVVDSFSLAPADFVPSGPRRYGLLTASRYPLTPELPGRFPVPWPERVLTTTAVIGGEAVELHVTHVPPGSSNGWVKIEHLEGLHRGLARPSVVPRILCGDFNTPQAELPSGEIVTWGQRRRRSGDWVVTRTMRGGLGTAWDAAERRVVGGLAEWDLVDVYRHLHGYGRDEASWILRRGASAVGRRFDHVFASSALRPVGCAYLHDFRERGLSDHSPIEAEFDWPGTAPRVAGGDDARGHQ
jgi:exonuclease III